MQDERQYLFQKQIELLFFKRTKASQLLLRSFLNAILSQSLKVPIKEIENAQGEGSNYSLAQPSSWLLTAVTETDKPLVIRVQIHDHDYFQKKTSKLQISHRLSQIETHRQADRYTIHILNFNLLQERDHYHHCFQTPSIEYTQHIHYIELLKFTSQTPETALEKWLYFICHLKTKEKPQLFVKLVNNDPYFKLANHLSRQPATTANRPAIVKEDPLNIFEWKYFGEKQEKERIALKMIRSGLPYQQIIDYTELTIEELDELALTIPMIDL